MTTALRRVSLLTRVSAQCCLRSQPHTRHFTSSSTLFEDNNNKLPPPSSSQAPLPSDQKLRAIFDENLPRYVRSPADLSGLPSGWQESLDNVESDIEASEADYEDLFRKSLGDRREEKFDLDEHEAAALLDEDSLEREPRWAEGFFAVDEERDDPGEDPEFENDDITSTAHGELEQHREMREYARIMAWDMPLLYNHAQPFQAPTAQQPLRFRYTTYLGEEHPAARKVVLTFNPHSLPNLSQQQSNKLIKLLGVRYNPSTTTAKLSCELYPTPAQNKRYLGDLLEKLTNEAKDAKDTFEDVPFDFRHHKPKPKHLFPEHWKLTEERRESLEARRQSVLKKEFEKMENGEVVEGAKLIEELLVQKAALPKQSAKGEKERELLGVGVLAGGDQKGKGQKGRIARQR